MNLPYNEILNYIIVLGGAAGSVWAFFKFVKPIMKSWIKDKVIIPAIQDSMQGMNNKLDTVINQLTINGGTVTIKDDLQAIKAGLRNLREEQRAHISLSNEPTFINDASGSCIMVNDALCELFGATKDQMLGYGWINFLQDNEKQIKQDNWNRSLKTDAYIKDSYTVIRGETHEKINCEYAATIIRDAKNNVVSVLGKVKRIS